MWTESKVGEGSTFSFTAVFGVSAGRAEREAPYINLKGVRILVIDDNATDRLILRETMVGLGAVVTDVDSGERGIGELKRARDEGSQFQLVLLDKRMPGMAGFQVIEEVRRDPVIAHTTIMMLTSDSSRKDLRRSREMGIGSYLVKPIKRTELLNAVAVTMSQAGVAAEEVQKAGIEGIRPLHILLADDSEDNRLLAKSYLKGTPHVVDEAGNGEEAARKVKSGRYDLVLMDMQMPVMDGYTATREIRRWESETGRGRTPVIALTAYALKEEEEKSLAAGCDAHVPKPVRKATILEVIERYAKGAGS